MSFLIKATMQDGIAAPFVTEKGILSIRVIHLVITDNATRYRGVPSASPCSPLVAAVGACGVSVLAFLPTQTYTVPYENGCMHGVLCAPCGRLRGLLPRSGAAGAYELTAERVPERLPCQITRPWPPAPSTLCSRHHEPREHRYS